LIVEPGERDVRPCFAQRGRDGRADSLLRAGDQRDLACQFHATSPNLSRETPRSSELSRNFAIVCEVVHNRADSVESAWPRRALDGPRWLNLGRCSMSRRAFLVTCLAILAAGALLPPSAAADEK